MTSTPISFLVPSYNAGPYLVEAVESIADQLVPGDEVLVQDGGSSDTSVSALLERYPDVSWLKLVSEPDRGQSDALQKALDRASNEYVMWLNADDVIYPGALEVFREALVAQPDLLFGRSTIFVNSGRVVRTYAPANFTRKTIMAGRQQMFTGSVAYRADLIRAAGGFDPRFEYCMDFDLFVRMAEREPSVAYVPDVVAGLRWHEASKGGSTIWPIVREATEIRFAHARSTREKATAVAVAGAYLAAGLLQPVRHSAPYSALRATLNGRLVKSGSTAR